MPTTELDARYGNAETAVPWEQAEEILAAAPLYWITTLRPDGRPHVTPLVAVWHDGAMHFRTGAEERKGRNLAANRTCLFTTGTNALHSGIDLVLEGEAVQVTSDTAVLQGIADAFLAKYGEEWNFRVEDALSENAPLTYRVEPTVVHAFGKDPYSQTKYAF
jgi:hypothetical protein